MKKIKKELITYRDIAMIVIGLAFATSVIMGVLWFNDNFILQYPIAPRDLSPIPDKPPIITPPKEKPIPTTQKPRTQSKAQIVASSKYPDFIDHIWERESTRGRNIDGLHAYCLQQGLSNEMGFYPTGKHCFPTFEASVRRLERWYEDNKALTDNQKLCRYNSGVASDTCAYLSYRFSEMN